MKAVVSGSVPVKLYLEKQPTMFGLGWYLVNPCCSVGRVGQRVGPLLSVAQTHPLVPGGSPFRVRPSRVALAGPGTGLT